MTQIIETEEELQEGKRRPQHPELDALYFFRPSTFNLERILDDYHEDVIRDEPDLIERCLPCLFRNIDRGRSEPPWYADWRLLVLPGLPSESGTPFNYATSRSWLDARIAYKPDEYARVAR